MYIYIYIYIHIYTYTDIYTDIDTDIYRLVDRDAFEHDPFTGAAHGVRHLP